MIQTNTKLGEENTVRIKMSDDETRIRVILSEASPLSDSQPLPQYGTTVLMEQHSCEATKVALLLHKPRY